MKLKDVVTTIGVLIVLAGIGAVLMVSRPVAERAYKWLS